MALEKIYFWTASINQWQPLLLADQFKDVVVNSLHHLSDEGKIDVFAFVIMPTHLHFIWRMNQLNGRELHMLLSLKFTAHEFQKLMRKTNIEDLLKYSVNASNKSFEF